MIAADGQSTQTVAGGVTAPAGFRAAGVACGIKANGKPDLSLLVSDGEASAAAVFTTNVAQAAPILVSREHLQQARRPRHGRGRQQRLRQRLHRRGRHARRARDDAAAPPRRSSAARPSVLVASTGVIGVKLPMAKVAAGIRLRPRALAPRRRRRRGARAS